MSNVTDRTDLEAPLTATESTLAEMWCDLLEIPEVAVDDDFFVLGATSLTAINFLQRVESTFGAEALSPDELYAEPRLSRIATLIDGKD